MHNLCISGYVCKYPLFSQPEIPEAIIPHRLPLEAAAEAFELARARESGSIKVVLTP